MIMDAEGLVLAGGRSSRMGQDKSSLIGPHRETLLQRAINTLQQSVAGPIRVSRPYQWPDPDPYDLPDTTAYRGPLQGIMQGLAACRRSWLAVLAVDCPNASSQVYDLLFEAADPKATVIIPRHGQILQPLLGLWSPRLIDHIDEQLRQGSLRVAAALTHSGVRIIDIADPRWLINLNNREEFEQWMERNSLVEPS